MGASAFSFIIPTLNEEKNLDICLTSLMKQTLDDFEVIIVDGGSRDKTIEIAEKYGFNILEVEKKRPHDVSAARNEGAKYARGDYVFFMDADMALDPNCVEVLERGYRQDDVVGIALKVLPYEGNGVENVMYEINNALARMSHFMGFYQLSYFTSHSYRKDCFEKVGGFREDLLACEDLDLSLRVSALGRYLVTHDATLWTSPRRLREWSYPGYVFRYLKYLSEYYLLKRVSKYYDDLPS